MGTRTQGEIICLGDFNCDSYKPNDWQWKKLNGLMSARQLKQVISKPTRVTSTSETLIDHVWTTHPNMYLRNGVVPFTLSDHSLIYAVRKALKIPKGPARNIKVRSYRTFNDTDFINELRHISWIGIETSNCPEVAWSIFESIFTRICDKHAPFKQVKILNRIPNWVNNEYITLRKELEQIKNGAQITKSQIDWDTFCQLRNGINNLAKRLKREFYETSIDDAGSDSKKLWKALKTILPSNKSSHIGNVRSGDEILTNESAIADAFKE